MKRLLELSNDAIGDIEHAYNYISDDNPAAGNRFLAHTLQSMNRLLDFPGIGPKLRYGSIADLRRWPVEGFESFLIFYKETDVGILIVRLLHGARNIEAILAETNLEKPPLD